jgi:hypothetical protein
MSIYDKIVDGKIYVLCSDQCDKFYIGYTTVNLDERLERHIKDYEDWHASNFEKGYLSSFEILKYGDYRIELLEDCPAISGWDLAKREQYHQITNYKDIVNINISGKGIIKKPHLTDTNDVYTCMCGYKMRNHYKVRRNHSLSYLHRQRIREIHSGVSKNKVYEGPCEIIFEYEGITLNINY